MWRAYSKKRQGEIGAAEARAADGPFLCVNPKCRRPVTFRCGPKLPPHFSHMWGRGSAECEHYGGRSGPVQSANYLAVARNRRNESPLPPAIYFGGDTAENFTVIARLPSTTAAPWSGSVVFREHGERRFRYEHLTRTCFFIVRPMSAYSIECRGEVDAGYRELLGSSIPGLAHELNVFPYAATRAEMLQPGRPLRCERRYWVLSQEDIAQHISFDKIQLASYPWLGWWVTRLELPALRLLGENDRQRLEAWIGRRVLAGVSQAWIIEPFPHHFTEDGMPVFPAETTHVVIAGLSNGSFQVQQDGEIIEQIVLPDGGVSRIAVEEGTWVLKAGDSEIAQWEIRECAFFEPPPVVLLDGISSIPLVDAHAQDWVHARRRGGTKLNLQVPVGQLWSVIHLDDGECVSSNAALVSETSVTRVRSIDAGNFGQLTSEMAPAVPVAHRFPELIKLQPTITWLSGLADRSSCGVHMRGRPHQRAPLWLQDLALARWKACFAPQVRALERELQRIGVWDVP